MRDAVRFVGVFCLFVSFVLLDALPVGAQTPVGVQTPTPDQTSSGAYRPVPIENFRTIVTLQKELGAEGFALILRINRVDLAHVRQGSTLLVPDRLDDIEALVPFPLDLDPAQAPPGRLLLVSRRVQAFAAYENHRRVRWGPTSTGRRETPTPAGLFHTNWKSVLRRSTDNQAWLLPWYVNFENQRGVSFHQFDLPGYPGSHACVRLLEEDARWIHAWAESWQLTDGGRTVLAHGTPVVVFGDYAYDATPPWTELITDPHAAHVSPTEIGTALAPHLTLIAARADERQRVLARPAQF